MTTYVTSRAHHRVDADLFIDNEDIGSDNRLGIRNPATPSEIVGSIVRGGVADVQRAVASAKRAQPAWEALGFRERASLMATGIARLGEGVEERKTLYVRENGKTLREAHGELAGLHTRLLPSLEYADELATPGEVSAPYGQTLITHKAYGVVVSIVPWNSPVALAFNQIVCGLLGGNTVVVKPPETSPLTLIACIKLFAQGLPPGVLNIVTGLPAEIGDALITHPDVGKIGFTGSIRSAKYIAASAAQSIKSVTLELGGNDPAILLEDVDLRPASMERMANAVFWHAGQVCMAIKRIYVPESIAAKFLEAFRAAADKMIIGDGLNPCVTLGPLHSELQRDKGVAIVEDARERGATVDYIGSIDDQTTFDQGYFMRPSIVTNVSNDTPLVADEQFCPSIPVITYRNIDEAIALANDSIFGLGGSVWSANVERAQKIGLRLETGTVWVNAHGTAFLNRSAPFGGFKQSGIGLKSGREGVMDYLRTQTVSTFAPVD